MADITDPSGAALRLSNDERERAVAALQAHATQGRLTDGELQTRSAAARSAVTRGDLAPLFADLPGGLHFDPHTPPAGAAPGYGAAPGTASAQSAPGASYPGQQNSQAPYPQQSQQQPYGAQPTGSGWSGREPSSRWGLLVVSIMPFVSVILFFVTGMVWGYQFSWLWFLLIPLVGAIVYGADGGRRR